MSRRYRHRAEEALFTGEPMDGHEVAQVRRMPVVHAAPVTARDPMPWLRSPRSPARRVSERSDTSKRPS